MGSLDIERLLHGGATFERTPSEIRSLDREVRAALHRRYRTGRARLRRPRWVCILAGALAILGFFGVEIVADLAGGPYGDPRADLAAGGVLGGFVALAACMPGALLVARTPARADAGPRQWPVSVRAGVDGGLLWLAQHDRLVVFTAKEAFVDVTRTVDHIVALVDDARVQAFPRFALARSEKGREVLDWFERHRPPPKLPSRADGPGPHQSSCRNTTVPR